MKKIKLKLADVQKFTAECFDRPEEVGKAARIIKGILEAQSPRLSEISYAMGGNHEANYKSIQRFLAASNPQKALLCLACEQASFILGDPTEIERKQARRTEYVGKLKDGKTRGFQLLPLAFPYRGRAIPFSFITYSSKTINEGTTSRNLEHLRVVQKLREALGERVLVLDREFSYEEFLQEMVKAGTGFVIRLNTSTNPTMLTREGERINLSICPGERVILEGVYYKGKVKVNLIGVWGNKFREPLWLITDLEPEEALQIYRARMKIEESFRDLKSLLRLDKIMNKKRENMEKVIALVLLAYAIALLIGEELRDRMYQGRKWRLYSGLFIFLKQGIRLTKESAQEVIQRAYLSFSQIVLGDVRTYV